MEKIGQISNLLSKNYWCFSYFESDLKNALISKIKKTYPDFNQSFEWLIGYTMLAYGVFPFNKMYLNNINTFSTSVNSQFYSIPTLSKKSLNMWDKIIAKIESKPSFSKPTTELISHLNRAIYFVEKNDSETFKYLNKWITHFCFFNKKEYVSASQPHCFGCIFLSSNILNLSIQKLSEHLVHELAHQELFLINFLDRLVTKEGDYSLVHAPLQGRSRPTIGRLHSAHVLGRIARFDKKIKNKSKRNYNLFFETYQTFKKNELTDAGWHLVDYHKKALTH